MFQAWLDRVSKGVEMAVSRAKNPLPGIDAGVQAARKEGFSLIEALIAVLLLAFVLLGIAYHELETTESVAQARRITEATNLAQMKLEELERLAKDADTFDDIKIGSTANPLNPLKPDGTNGGIYYQTWTVGSYASDPDLKDATVTVSWSDKDEKGAHDDSVQLSTLFRRP